MLTEVSRNEMAIIGFELRHRTEEEQKFMFLSGDLVVVVEILVIWGVLESKIRPPRALVGHTIPWGSTLGIVLVVYKLCSKSARMVGYHWVS